MGYAQSSGQTCGLGTALGFEPDSGLVDRATFHRRFASLTRGGPERGPSLLLVELGEAVVNDPELSARFVDAAGTDALVARLGCGRIAVLLMTHAKRSPEAMAMALLGALVRPLAGRGLMTMPEARLSIALWDVDGGTPEQLYVVADWALQAARQECADQLMPRLRCAG